MSYKNIVMKALNTYEVISPITGLGIKCILDQMQSERIKNKLDGILSRKLEVSPNIKIRKYKSLKSNNVIKSLSTYRDVATPSAFGALMEAKFISGISPKSLNRPSVYSYRIPHNNEEAFRNFEYYYENYIDMNKAILKSLERNKLNSVFILDLKSFYPSINIPEAITTLSEHTHLFSSIKKTFNNFKGGVPIGLDLSHVLAQSYLTSFDKVMVNKFGHNYFRYVDDISITCNQEDLPSIELFVRENLPKGLAINEDKLDSVDVVNWREFTKNIEERYRLDSFSTVLSIYVAFNSEVTELSEKLNKMNIHLPLYKFKTRVRTSTFAKYFKILERKKLRLISSIFRWNEDDLVNFLINRKKFHLEAVNSTLKDIENYLDAKDVTTRFRVQHLKYHLSNLFYLLSDNELLELKDRADKHQELFYFSAIVQALLFHDFQNLFELGGRYIVMFNELCKARNKDIITLNFNEFDDLNHYSESLIYLYITGVITFNIKDIKSKYTNTNSYDFLVSLIQRDTPYQGNDEYIKEIQMLLSIYDDNQLKELMNSKFDDSEYIDFYATDYPIGS
jgi:hypothetical protein